MCEEILEGIQRNCTVWVQGGHANAQLVGKRVDGTLTGVRSGEGERTPAMRGGAFRTKTRFCDPCWVDEHSSKCCRRVGTDKHRRYQCESWQDARGNILNAARMWGRKMQHRRRIGFGKEV